MCKFSKELAVTQTNTRVHPTVDASAYQVESVLSVRISQSMCVCTCLVTVTLHEISLMGLLCLDCCSPDCLDSVAGCVKDLPPHSINCEPSRTQNHNP